MQRGPFDDVVSTDETDKAFAIDDRKPVHIVFGERRRRFGRALAGSGGDQLLARRHGRAYACR
jgi:hypothetical protein